MPRPLVPRPVVGVGAIITGGGGSGEKILLTRRAVEPYRGVWAIPGGHIERYETAEEALRREIMEEVGLLIEPRFFGYFDGIVRRRGIHGVVLVFTAVASGEPEARDEVAEVGWFTADEALARRLAFDHHQIVEAFAQRPGAPTR